MKNVMKLIAVILVASMLALPVAAAGNFTPSVEMKDAPTLAVTPSKNADTNEEATNAAVIVYDAEGEEVAYIPADGIRITPYAERETVEDYIREEMEEAYTAIEEKDDLKDAVASLGKTLEMTIEKMVSEGFTPDANLTEDNLIVRDVINVGLDAESKALMAQGVSLGITFDLKVEKSDPLICMRYVDIDDVSDGMLLVLEEKGWLANLWEIITGQRKSDMTWVPVDPSELTINDDGTGTAHLARIGDDIGTLAFVNQSIEE